MKPNLLHELTDLISSIELYKSNTGILKNKLIEDGFKNEPALIQLLLTNPNLKKHFFTELENQILIFNALKFQQFLSLKDFLPDSYTSFSNKIGLTSNGDYISQNKNVVLDFPFKDCVLEGGQSKDDTKRKEIFWSETLAPDEIDVLLEPKILTNVKKYTPNGEEEVTEFNRNSDGVITDNLIIKGNNLIALHSLKKEFKGKVKLIYIDPPYNTGSDSFGYNDKFNHSTWLVFMKNRLEAARELLRDDGFIYIHISQHEYSYLKILADEVFDNNDICVFNLLVRHPDRILKKDKEYHDVIEYVLVYTKNKIKNKLPKLVIDNDLEDYTYCVIEKSAGTKIFLNEKEVIYFKPEEYDEIRKPFGKENFKKISIRGSLKEGNSSGRFYTALIEPDLEKYAPSSLFKIPNMGNDDSGSRYFYTPQANKQNGGYYQGVPINWTEKDIKPYPNFFDFVSEFNNAGYEGGVEMRNGKKPEALILKLIEVSGTQVGDIVLDYHLGSGTTAAVAHKMGLQYIGVEQMDYIQTITVERMKKVVGTETTSDDLLKSKINTDFDNGGISKAVNWEGGGEFIYCELKQYNQNFIDRIQVAKNQKDIKSIWTDIQNLGSMSYKVNLNSIADNSTEFENLIIEDGKKFLMEVLDKNMLYFNLSNIDNADFPLTDDEKAINKSFYNLKK